MFSRISRIEKIMGQKCPKLKMSKIENFQTDNLLKAA